MNTFKRFSTKNTKYDSQNIDSTYSSDPKEQQKKSSASAKTNEDNVYNTDENNYYEISLETQV